MVLQYNILDLSLVVLRVTVLLEISDMWTLFNVTNRSVCGFWEQVGLCDDSKKALTG